MMDFTFQSYKQLLESFIEKYSLHSLNIDYSSGRHLLIRHDIDRQPQNALTTAKLENALKVTGTYYFRYRKDVFIPSIIQEIASLKHDVGYHYENLSVISEKLKLRKEDILKINLAFRPALLNALGKQKTDENIENNLGIRESEFDSILRNLETRVRIIAENLFEEAIMDFQENLYAFRKIANIETISMHGSPSSLIDNRLLWLKYNYFDSNILLEPYFDLDYNEVFYITDASRKW
ncbi:MAG: hypothetical protein JXR56_02760, partial [Candidatus Cloacimonetes bacterium]|nr:hypothetical protein [Candidatus Cloacimonadota bacterium]